jgi:phosphoribosylformimino-5-aminoimidazole carboxamide ribotide isomerase
MIIIPAIDIKDGQCVRLYQGEMDKETVYFSSPVDAAKHWVDHGAEWLHVVDLNGAVEGRPVHKEEVAAICMGFGVPVQLGGGLRSLESIEEALAFGVARVILGTAAYENPDFLRQACVKFPGRIIVGIDARDGRVAVKGW